MTALCGRGQFRVLRKGAQQTAVLLAQPALEVRGLLLQGLELLAVTPRLGLRNRELIDRNGDQEGDRYEREQYGRQYLGPQPPQWEFPARLWPLQLKVANVRTWPP